MSPNTKIIQCDTARRLQATRDLEALPWATRPSISVGLSKLVIFGLTPVCVIAWLVSR